MQTGVKKAIQEYNISQFIVCPVKEDPEQKVMVTKHAQLEDQRTFLAPHLKKKFTFDHVLQVASHLEDDSRPESDSEHLRIAVEKEIDAYVKNHYPNGFSAVYSVNGDIIICIASNKYNSNNFWYHKTFTTYAALRYGNCDLLLLIVGMGAGCLSGS